MTSNKRLAKRRPKWLRLALGLLSLVYILSACAEAPESQAKLKSQALISGTLAVSVSDGLDDAEEYSSGSVNRSSSDLDLGLFPTTGMRFNGISIPQGATIENAYLQFKTDEAHTTSSVLTLQAEAADDAAALTSQKFNLSSRPATSAAVSWTPDLWQSAGEAGPAQQSPDIAPVLQELVDRPGWDSGNSLLILVTGTGEHVAESYNGDPAGAPRLHVDYSFDDNPPNIGSFAASPTGASLNEDVSFTWSVTDPTGQALSCTLDIDDDGTPDYSLGDCDASSQIHVYTAGGEYTARLSVTDEDNAVSEATVTVSVADSTDTVTVAAAGDIACDPTSSRIDGANPNHCQMGATAQLMLDMGLDAVLSLGDTAYQEGTYEQFMATYEPSWGQLKDITYPAVGNHEYLTPGASGYFQYFGAAAGDPTKGYYSYGLGSWHIVVLNSSCSQVGGCSAFSPQGQWLRADLAANTSPCTLAYWHIPLFSSGRIGNRTHTQEIWVELYDAGVDVVLGGHDHDYERFAPQDPFGAADPVNGIRQFVVGTGGKSVLDGGTLQPNSEVIDNDTLGVLKLTLHPSSYDWEFVPIPGKSFSDTGSRTCH